MKKIKLTYALIMLISLGAFCFTSCKKDKDDKPEEKEEVKKEPTNEEKVMAGEWKITKIMSSGMDVFNGPLQLFEACQKDNIYTFEVNDVLNINEGEEKCDENAPDDVQGSWFMVGKDRMYIDLIMLSDTADIVKATDKTLVLSAELEELGIDGVVTFTKLEK